MPLNQLKSQFIYRHMPQANKRHVAVGCETIGRSYGQTDQSNSITNIAESLTHLLFADCKRKLRNRQRLLYKNMAVPSAILVRSTKPSPNWFARFVKPVSDSTNRLRETGKSYTGFKPVWQIDYALKVLKYSADLQNELTS